MNNNTETTPQQPLNWAGDEGERWNDQVDLFESMIAPVGKALLDKAAFAAGERVVDIGCGGGWTSRQIAQAVGSTGSVLGFDISPTLIETATDRAKRDGVKNLRFLQGDAENTIPDGAPFDRLFSRFGVMFFQDPYAAFANLNRMLHKGGRLSIAVWAPAGDNPWSMEIRKIVSKYVTMPDPQPRAAGPFALGEADYLTDLLEKAGFSGIRFDTWEGPLNIGGINSTPESAVKFMMHATQAGELAKQGGAAIQQAAERDLVELFKVNYASDGVKLGGKVWLVSASA